MSNIYSVMLYLVDAASIGSRSEQTAPPDPQTTAATHQTEVHVACERARSSQIDPSALVGRHSAIAGYPTMDLKDLSTGRGISEEQSGSVDDDVVADDDRRSPSPRSTHLNSRR